MTLRVYDREIVTRLLAAAGCVCEGVAHAGYETWVMASGESFTLVLEPFDLYDEMTIRGVFEFTLGLPLPPELS